MIDTLAKLPLPVQPGTDWRYGPSVNIQGYIVEKLSGQTARRVPPHAHLRAAEDEGHRLLGGRREGATA